MFKNAFNLFNKMKKKYNYIIAIEVKEAFDEDEVRNDVLKREEVLKEYGLLMNAILVGEIAGISTKNNQANIIVLTDNEEDADYIADLSLMDWKYLKVKVDYGRL